MLKQQEVQERELVRLIQAGISRAEAEGRVIDRDTARRIAAAIHRGLGGELERLAGSGQLRHVHAARLELFYTLKDEPGFAAWGAALSGFINERGRAGGKTTKPAVKQQRSRKSVVGSSRLSRRAGGEPEGVLLQANPEPNSCGPCDPQGVLVYVCNQPGDQAERDGLALQMQHLACRRFVRRQLKKRLEATFADNAHTRRAGLRRLLAHQAICHNHRVVVERLDRLPPGSVAADQVTVSGARVLSASEQSPRSNRRQAALAQDVAELARQGRKHVKRGQK